MSVASSFKGECLRRLSQNPLKALDVKKVAHTQGALQVTTPKAHYEPPNPRCIIGTKSCYNQSALQVATLKVYYWNKKLSHSRYIAGIKRHITEIKSYHAKGTLQELKMPLLKWVILSLDNLHAVDEYLVPRRLLAKAT